MDISEKYHETCVVGEADRDLVEEDSHISAATQEKLRFAEGRNKEEGDGKGTTKNSKTENDGKKMKCKIADRKERRIDGFVMRKEASIDLKTRVNERADSNGYQISSRISKGGVAGRVT